MSPEQVEGKEVDGRSDIFSFGAVLYEMVTGQLAFQGKSQVSVASAILEKEPTPISSIKPLTPPALDHAIRRCLAKDPEERWQMGRDLHGELLWISESAPRATPLHPSRRERKLERLAWVAAAVFALIAVVALWAPWRVERPAPRPVARLTMEVAPAEMLGPTRFFSRPTYLAIAISPDDKAVVFSGTHGPSTRSQTQLYKRLLDQSDATVIPGTEGAAVPFFSPDGQWVGFFADGELKKVPINGGPAAVICDAPSGGFWGASWAPTDNIVFALTYSAATLMQVPATGGKPQVLLKSNPAKQDELYAAPQFLPDGKTLLFTVRTSDNWGDAQIVVRRLDTGEQRVLIKGGADARYALSGYLVYMQNAVLMAVPFDAQRLQLAGAPVAMLDGVMQAAHTSARDAETGMGQFAISASGNLIYAAGGISPGFVETLLRVDQKGRETELNVPKGPYGVVRIASDGQRMAITRQAETNKTSDIWVVDAKTGRSTRLTTQGTNSWPVWSPDGKRILFSGGAVHTQLLSVTADGSGPPELVSTGTTVVAPASWSSDGKWLAYYEQQSHGQIWARPMSGPGEPKRFGESEFNLVDGQFSADGRWMAYVSDESGAREVYVQAFPGPSEKHRISIAGGVNPAWARNGRELFYLQPLTPLDGTYGQSRESRVAMMSVDFASGSTFKASMTHTLFEGKWSVTFPFRDYDVTPDGQHFIMLRTEEPPDQRVTKLNVVLNRFEELKKRVPRSAD
jgi:serine/threonine-protein kinase